MTESQLNKLLYCIDCEKCPFCKYCVKHTTSTDECLRLLKNKLRSYFYMENCRAMQKIKELEENQK